MSLYSPVENNPEKPTPSTEPSKPISSSDPEFVKFHKDLWNNTYGRRIIPHSILQLLIFIIGAISYMLIKDSSIPFDKISIILFTVSLVIIEYGIMMMQTIDYWLKLSEYRFGQKHLKTLRLVPKLFIAMGFVLMALSIFVGVAIR